MQIEKRKRILMLTDGNIDNASARIRAIQYIPFFEELGYQIILIPRIPKRPTHTFDKYFLFPILKRLFNVRMVLAILFVNWKFVFIQRVFVKEFLLKKLIAKSIPIIYDFDDAIYINSSNPECEAKTETMIRNATKVIISTDYLQEFCFRNNKTAEVINTPVETDRIKPIFKTKEHLITIGWIGSPWTSGFLEIVGEPLQRLAKKYTFCFLTIGAKQDYAIEGVNHVKRTWAYENENEDLGNMDIGIMPLPATDYAAMKGGYKLIQYMSAGIPFVASPVGINQSIVIHGENGLLASNNEEWYEMLEILLNNPELRAKLGLVGRQNAIELYSREVCFNKLQNIMQKI